MLSLKNRVGNFLLLFGFIALLIFGATAITPPGQLDLWAFLIGSGLVGLGLRFRLDKKGRALAAPPPRPAGPPPAARAAKGKGPGKGGAPAGPPPGPPPQPKKQGPLAAIFKGPANKKTAPKGGPPSGGGGGGGKPKK